MSLPETATSVIMVIINVICKYSAHCNWGGGGGALDKKNGAN